MYFLALLFVILVFSGGKVQAEIPYTYYCLLSPISPTPQLSLTPSVAPGISPTLVPSLSPTIAPSQIISPTVATPHPPSNSPTLRLSPTATVSVTDTCIFNNSILAKGEGICNEKTNTVNLCEGNNRMSTKADYCGIGRVCRSNPGSHQVSCDAVCQLKHGTGATSKADLVILAEDYPSYDTFLVAVDKSVAAIRKTNLGPQRLDKINIWALMSLNQTYFQGFNCPSPSGRSVACWNYAKAANLALTTCGGDVHVILNNDTHRTGSVGGIAIWGSAYIFNFALDFPTVPHELGHAMAGLNDEYSFGIAAPSGINDGVNCSSQGAASQNLPCPKWAGRFPNVGCYPRCGYTNFFRPSLKSIMDRGGTNAVWDFNEPSLIDGWDEVLKYFQ